MAIALVKLLGMLFALALAIGILVVVVVLAIAVLRMVGVTLVQWRDVFSLDRWQEVLVTIGRNKLRTALTMISVAWGIMVLVSLLGLGVGLDQGMRKQFARDATNGVWVMANKTSVAYGGYDVGRRLMFENSDFNRAKNIKGIDHMSAQHYIGGRRWGASIVTRHGAKANTFDLQAVYASTFYLESNELVVGRFLSDADVAQRRKAADIGKNVDDF
jgi:putative ABC transport system permease protein